MKCVSCGATLPAGVDVCRHCETLNDVDFRLLGQARVAASDQERVEAHCPRCRVPLISLCIQMGESYPVHRCKGCLGTFFPSPDLQRLVRNVSEGQGLDRDRLAQLCRESPPEIWPIAYIPCPVCRETMERSSYGKTSGVLSDQCYQHGVWLDGGELGRLLSWARAGGTGGEAPQRSGVEEKRTAHQQLITRFYQAFQRKDPRAMAECYHPQATFGDPAFPHLEVWRACAMWMMLCERGKDLKLQFRNVRASHVEGEAFWEAHYTFGQTGHKVHNQIYATFRFRDGLIWEHRDSFDMRRWMHMALGFKGKVLGFLPFGQRIVQKTAAQGLEQFILSRNLKAEDFRV